MSRAQFWKDKNNGFQKERRVGKAGRQGSFSVGIEEKGDRMGNASSFAYTVLKLRDMHEI